MLAYRNLAQIEAAAGNAPPAGCANGYAYAQFHDILRLVLFLGFAG